jgi:hypothetical protein
MIYTISGQVYGDLNAAVALPACLRRNSRSLPPSDIRDSDPARSTSAEYDLTKTIAILALTCCLVAVAAVVSIVGRDSVPMASAEMVPTRATTPVANREVKQDKLVVATLAPDLAGQAPALGVGEPLRQAYASSSVADVEAAAAVTSALPRPLLLTPPKTRASTDKPSIDKPSVDRAIAAKPLPPKPYALLSDAQIAGIKQRLRLSSDQESYWPAVEVALRAVARKIHVARQANPNATAASIIDPDSDEAQQLKSAAMPLLFQLREDQKDEVRALARVIGLDKVASQI